MSVLCAVCAEANDDLVLSCNVVDSLLNKQTQVELRVDATESTKSTWDASSSRHFWAKSASNF